MLGVIVAWVIIGIVAGFLAKLVVKGEGPGGILGDMVVGIAGAFIGGFIWQYFGSQGFTGLHWHSLVVAFVGAVILLLIIRLLHGMRSST